MLTILCRPVSPATVALLLVAGGAACGRPARPDVTQGRDTAVRPPNAVQEIDSTAAPIIITLQRDSLGLARPLSPARVDSAIARAIVELQGVVAFDVLAVSGPVFGLSVRPRAPMTGDGLIAALRRHRLVADIQPSGIVRRP